MQLKFAAARVPWVLGPRRVGRDGVEWRAETRTLEHEVPRASFQVNWVEREGPDRTVTDRFDCRDSGA